MDGIGRRLRRSARESWWGLCGLLLVGIDWLWGLEWRIERRQRLSRRR